MDHAHNDSVSAAIIAWRALWHEFARLMAQTCAPYGTIGPRKRPSRARFKALLSALHSCLKQGLLLAINWGRDASGRDDANDLALGEPEFFSQLAS